MNGTVTISIQELDRLRNLEKNFNELLNERTSYFIEDYNKLKKGLSLSDGILIGYIIGIACALILKIAK